MASLGRDLASRWSEEGFESADAALSCESRACDSIDVLVCSAVQFLHYNCVMSKR